MINPFLLLIIGVPTSMLIIPLAWKLAPRLGMLDAPDSRKVHSKPIPRVGGWGIVAGSLVPLLVMRLHDTFVLSYLAAAFILFSFGAWDDAKQISHWIKFVGQFMAAALVVYYGDMYVVDWPFVADAIPEATSKAVSVIALMGMINAINHSDGLDGLAAGESTLSLIAIGTLGFMASNDLTVAIAASTIGGILGFLRYNTHPAEVFMGDAGSQFLGLTLGVLAIYLTQIAMPAMSSALPLLFLGLPISDILMVLYKRIKGKMNWFKATRNHIHHRLLDLGFDHYETVVLIYSVQALLVTLAVLMRFQSDYLVVGTYFLIVITFFVLLSVAESTGWRRRTIGPSWFATTVELVKRNRQLRRLPYLAITALFPMLVLAGAVLPTHVPRDFGIASMMLALVLGAEVVFIRRPGSAAGRMSMYVAAIFGAYLFFHFPPDTELPMWGMSLAVLVVLAIAVSLYIRYTSDHRFGATPTDYLIVFGIIALLVFGGMDVRVRETVQTIIFSVVLLYACEAVAGETRQRLNPMILSTLGALGILAVRGFM